MEKPIIAAVNGMALGGGLELAIRCHGMVATKNALFQFPEITLGILPGIGGCIVPYRKWPKGAALFHEMICLGKPIRIKEAVEIGMVDEVAEDYTDLITKAVALARGMGGNLKRILDGKVEIPKIEIPPEPLAGKLALSKEAVSIVVKTIERGVSAESFREALEIGYTGFGETACTEAAREGITAFLEKRKPDFRK
jgi:enoyl-CoA hydratase / 3-hydroxyacyl-CoA dehydrogenase